MIIYLYIFPIFSNIIDFIINNLLAVIDFIINNFIEAYSDQRVSAYCEVFWRVVIGSIFISWSVIIGSNLIIFPTLSYLMSLIQYLSNYYLIKHYYNDFDFHKLLLYLLPKILKYKQPIFQWSMYNHQSYYLNIEL